MSRLGRIRRNIARAEAARERRDKTLRALRIENVKRRFSGKPLLTVRQWKEAKGDWRWRKTGEKGAEIPPKDKLDDY